MNLTYLFVEIHFVLKYNLKIFKTNQNLNLQFYFLELFRQMRQQIRILLNEVNW